MPAPDASSEALVRSFFEILSAGDLDSLKTLLHDDATWTLFAEGLPGAGRHAGREAIVEDFLRPVREGMFEPGDPKVEIQALVAAAGSSPSRPEEADGSRTAVRTATPTRSSSRSTTARFGPSGNTWTACSPAPSSTRADRGQMIDFHDPRAAGCALWRVWAG
jgi:SnoaL-like domain